MTRKSELEAAKRK